MSPEEVPVDYGEGARQIEESVVEVARNLARGAEGVAENGRQVVASARGLVSEIAEETRLEAITHRQEAAGAALEAEQDEKRRLTYDPVVRRSADARQSLESSFERGRTEIRGIPLLSGQTEELRAAHLEETEEQERQEQRRREKLRELELLKREFHQTNRVYGRLSRR